MLLILLYRLVASSGVSEEHSLALVQTRLSPAPRSKVTAVASLNSVPTVGLAAPARAPSLARTGMKNGCVDVAEGTSIESMTIEPDKEIDEILRSADSIVSLVNATMHDVVHPAANTARFLSELLKQFKLAAAVMGAVIGEDLAREMLAKLDALLTVTTAAATLLEESEARIQGELHDNVERVSRKGGELRTAFKTVAASVSTLSTGSSTSSSSLLEHDEVLAWPRLPPWLGGPKPTPCQKAAHDVKDANRSVAELEGMFFNLNKTVVDDHLGSLLKELNSTATAAEAVLATAFGGLSSKGTTVGEGTSSLLSIMTSVRAKTADGLTTLPNWNLNGVEGALGSRTQDVNSSTPAGVEDALATVGPLRELLQLRQTEVMNLTLQAQDPLLSLYCSLQEWEAVRMNSCK